jgi:hypothetical protein
MEDIEPRALLTRLLDDEPPAPDIAPYISKARRDTARRRWAFAGASSVAVAAVVAAVVVAPNLLPHAPQPGGQVGAPGAGVPTAKATMVPKQRISTETPAAASARLTAALAAAYPLPPGTHAIKTRWDFMPALRFRPSQGGYKAMADIQDGEGTGSVFFEVDGNADIAASRRGCTPPQVCTRTPDGDLLIVQHLSGPEPGIVTRIVTAVRTDGTSMLMWCTNYGQSSVPQVKNGPPARPQRSTPPLTEAQMEAIVLTPALSYYP